MADDLQSILERVKSSPEAGAGDFWAFRTMITPLLIQLLFWIGVVTCVVVGIMIVVHADQYRDEGLRVMMGIGWVLLGPVVVRLYCEWMILGFRINATLTDIRNELLRSR